MSDADNDGGSKGKPLGRRDSGNKREEAVRNGFVRAMRWCGRMAFRFIIFCIALWCGLALYFLDVSTAMRDWLVGVFLLVSIILLFFVRPRRRGIIAFLVLAAGIIVFWLFIPPSNDRPWRTDVSVLSSADVNGNQVTIHNVRNSDYKTATDFTLKHDDRTYDLDKLRSVDFFMCFWAQIPFCHTMISFGFDDGQYVCFSIETRPEEHEGFDPIAGSFKQFELIYVVGDERDLVRLRTNFRDETVYLFHIVTTPEAKRRMFLRYCSRLNDLYAKPEWYCTFTRNCTTDMPRPQGRLYRRFPESWKVLINGFVDRFLYEQGSLDRRMALSELRRVGHINTRAENAGNDPDFSKKIREGIPDLD